MDGRYLKSPTTPYGRDLRSLLADSFLYQEGACPHVPKGDQPICTQLHRTAAGFPLQFPWPLRAVTYENTLVCGDRVDPFRVFCVTSCPGPSGCMDAVEGLGHHSMSTLPLFWPLHFQS